MSYPRSHGQLEAGFEPELSILGITKLSVTLWVPFSVLSSNSVSRKQSLFWTEFKSTIFLTHWNFHSFKRPANIINHKIENKMEACRMETTQWPGDANRNTCWCWEIKGKCWGHESSIPMAQAVAFWFLKLLKIDYWKRHLLMMRKFSQNVEQRDKVLFQQMVPK